jgi:ATP-binding cassette subfamily B multidrug efflux pump
MSNYLSQDKNLKFRNKKDLVYFILLERFPHRLFIIALALTASVCGLLVPFFQNKFVETMSLTQLGLTTGLAFISFTCFQLTNYFGNKEALICQSRLSSYLYNHILNLKSLSTMNTVGEKVALYATDVPSATMWLEQSIPYFFTTVFPLILTPIFLYYFYNLPLSFSLIVIGILILFNMLMAYRQSIFFYRFKILAGQRMGLVNEWVQNIKSLKTLNWITAFENKIIKKRKEETHNRILMVTNGQIMNSFSASITFWLNLFVLIFILLTASETIEKQNLLVLLWVMGIFLSRPLRQLPWLLTMLFDALTSVNRLFDFYKLENKESIIKSESPKQKNTTLEIENLNLTLENTQLLKNIFLNVEKNEIIGLIGPVGSGKSLLLKSILNETTITADHLYRADCSYLPQEPFILSSTIKDNISLTYDSTESDQECLQALDNAEFDILADRLPEGLKTSIGERGLNLSGGQKQRLNLSRIFFHPQPLILLDDPFSAVDVGTEAKLIHNIQKLQQKGHSFLVTTQRYSFLEYCDRVIFLDQGEIQFDGKLSDFKAVEKYRKFLE